MKTESVSNQLLAWAALAASGFLLGGCYNAGGPGAQDNAASASQMSIGYTTINGTRQPYVVYVDSTAQDYYLVSSGSPQTLGSAGDATGGAVSVPQDGNGFWVARTNDSTTNLDHVGADGNSESSIPLSGIAAQTSLQVRADGTVLALGVRSFPANNGVGLQKSVQSLTLMSVTGPSGVTQTSQYLATGNVEDPVLGIDASSQAYIAAWMDSDSEDVSAEFVNKSGTKQDLAGVISGSPKAAWTDGNTFKIASIDENGQSHLSDGQTETDGPDMSGALCRAMDFGSDGTLSVLTVSNQQVVLTQLAPGMAAATLQLAGALDPMGFEISRSSSCAVSHDGGNTLAAWQGTQSPTKDGNNVFPGVLYAVATGTQLVSNTRFALQAEKYNVQLSLTFSGAGQGIIYGPSISYNNQMECDSPGTPPAYSWNTHECSISLPVNTSVSLQGAPVNSGSFTGWDFSAAGIPTPSGCAGGATTCTFNLSQPMSVGGIFSPAQITVDTVASAYLPGGTITSSPAGISCETAGVWIYYSCSGGGVCGGHYGTCVNSGFAVGSQVTLTAVPQDPVYWLSSTYTLFTGWGGVPGCNDSSPTCLVTITDQPLTIKPQFAFILKSIDVALTGTGSGAVTAPADVYGNPAIACGENCSSSLIHGESIVLTAVPAVGSTFTGWTNCPSVGGADGYTCTITYSESSTTPAAVDVTANFDVQD